MKAELVLICEVVQGALIDWHGVRGLMGGVVPEAKGVVSVQAIQLNKYNCVHSSHWRSWFLACSCLAVAGVTRHLHLPRLFAKRAGA